MQYRGSIEKIDHIRPTNANLTLSENKQKLVWNVGSKFPSKNLEMSLGATVTFVEFPPEDLPVAVGDRQQRTDDKFCVGNNSYCEVSCEFFPSLLLFVYMPCLLSPPPLPPPSSSPPFPPPLSQPDTFQDQ